ncbi:uncharacterized protein LOC114246284 [Bombyx mandarina]|uniref:Uncharacterized protein LOC114246284 n=1 Tax=Bombyx mandarina TaxID=7092 RepID=A0A6J2JY99_BOMMA|nr:uncharacterized protein LOC114246284 [Bombyx mandarina]
MHFVILICVFGLVANAAVIDRGLQTQLNMNREVNKTETIIDDNANNVLKGSNNESDSKAESRDVLKPRSPKNIEDGLSRIETIDFGNTAGVVKEYNGEAVVENPTDRLTEDFNEKEKEFEPKSNHDFFEGPSIFPIIDCPENCTELDFNEFIFNEDIQSKYKDEYYDDANDFFLDASRFKRSVNIIEEENRAVTVPSYKISVKDMKFSDTRSFNNVHT